MSTPETDSAARSWFRSANCDARYGAGLLGILGLLVALAATGEPARVMLGYDRDALAHFQYWRLLTAHLVHLDWPHTVLNGAGVAVLWALFAREFAPTRWLWVLFAA